MMALMAPVLGLTVAVAVAPVPGSTTVGVTVAANEYVRAWPKSGNAVPPSVIVAPWAGAAGAG